MNTELTATVYGRLERLRKELSGVWIKEENECMVTFME